MERGGGVRVWGGGGGLEGQRYPEDDWWAEERQAEDKDRADARSTLGETTIHYLAFKQKPMGDQLSQYGTMDGKHGGGRKRGGDYYNGRDFHSEGPTAKGREI